MTDNPKVNIEVDVSDAAAKLTKLDDQVVQLGLEPTLDEFGPSLKRGLGLDRPHLARMIIQATKAGAADPDYPAGALREFWIRTTDGFTLASQGALDILGLERTSVREAVSAGGDRAREMLGEVLHAFRHVDDGYERHAAAVALFGVAAEDLGDALFAMEVQ